MGLSFRVVTLVERLFATSFNTLHPILALMGCNPRLSASRPSGACPLFPLRTFSMLYLCLFLLCLAGSRIASGLRNCSAKLQRYFTNTGKNGAVRARPADCVMTKRAGNNRLPRLQADSVFVQE